MTLLATLNKSAEIFYFQFDLNNFGGFTKGSIQTFSTGWPFFLNENYKTEIFKIVHDFKTIQLIKLG